MTRAAWIAGAVALAVAASAHADPGAGDVDATQLICGASRLGESPAQIAAQLQDGDGRWNAFRTAQTVLPTIITECG